MDGRFMFMSAPAPGLYIMIIMIIILTSSLKSLDCPFKAKLYVEYSKQEGMKVCING